MAAAADGVAPFRATFFSAIEVEISSKPGGTGCGCLLWPPAELWFQTSFWDHYTTKEKKNLHLYSFFPLHSPFFALWKTSWMTIFSGLIIVN